MSDSFANEFEKWLENNPVSRNTNESEEEESNEGNDRECAINTVQSCQFEGESDRLHKSLSEKHDEKLTCISDQAPILVDDDDDVFPNGKRHYEDEPPILEPVPRQLQSNTVQAVRNPQFHHQPFMRSYSRNDRMRSRRYFLKDPKRRIKTYSSRDRSNHLAANAFSESSHNSSKSKDKNPSNIFDKFISEQYDCPPPLIPCPEVLQVHSETPSTGMKNANHSPEFCAMEADSTSEINGSRVDCNSRSRRPSKNSVHGDISVECDSTCMLATSPIVVSPASVSNSEIEETRDCVEGGNKDIDLDVSGCSLKKIDNSPVWKTDCEEQSKIMQRNRSRPLVCKNVPENNRDDKDSMVKMALEDLKSSSFSDQTEAQSLISNVPGHPVLQSAVSDRSHYMLRRKRHTIDSPETFSRTRKRSHTISYVQPEINISDLDSPPSLTDTSGVTSFSSRGKRSKTLLQHSKYESFSRHQDKRPRQLRHKRCNTLPIADLTKYCSHLPEDLRNFVVHTSQLSDLQTHMHKLLHKLFPQLRTELDAMSPESFKFERLLFDLVRLLEQPDGHDDSAPPTLISVYDCPRQVSVHMSWDNTDEPPSSGLSSHDSQAADDFANHVFRQDATSSDRNSPSLMPYIDAHDCRQKQHSYPKTQYNYQDSDKDLVIPLSNLTLKDLEENLAPSKVLLCKDPEARFETFIQLTCRILQLLLPDLTVSLYSELSHSPSDLVAFINNMILTNSKGKYKR